MVWAFIRDNFIDREYGEWFRNLYNGQGIGINEGKANDWFFPYHSPSAWI